MARMGKDGYSSQGQAQLTARVPEGLKEEFKQTAKANDETLTDAIVKKVEEYVAENSSETYDSADTPDLTEKERELYETCLEIAEDTGNGWKIYQRRHAREIAQTTRQVSKDELTSALMPLRRKGYIARGMMPMDLDSQQAKQWRHWHVKPRHADPVEWKRSEVNK